MYLHSFKGLSLVANKKQNVKVCISLLFFCVIGHHRAGHFCEIEGHLRKELNKNLVWLVFVFSPRGMSLAALQFLRLTCFYTFVFAK